MKNIYVNWLKKEIIGQCQIKRGTKNLKQTIGESYKEIFNDSPFYESWTNESAIQVIEEYLENKTNILVPMIQEQAIGFLISTDEIPMEQKEFITYPVEKIRYIEEIGVLKKYRENNIASELVRQDLINALILDKEYLAYRTNMIRYFKPEYKESFETAAERIKELDQKARKENQPIRIPNMTIQEKQEFVNQYIPLIQRRDDLDNSNSNRLFKKIFGNLEFCKEGNNYTWQKDPSDENNDRIFPIVDLKKNGYIKTRFGQGGMR